MEREINRRSKNIRARVRLAPDKSLRGAALEVVLSGNLCKRKNILSLRLSGSARRGRDMYIRADLSGIIAQLRLGFLVLYSGRRFGIRCARRYSVRVM